MVKVIFSDFDNTMLNYYSDNNYFDDYQIGVLSKLKQRGLKFCIVTGRSVTFFNRFPNLMNVVDYIIGSNGACIYDVKNDKYIYQKFIGDNELNKLIYYSLEHNYSFLLNCLNKRYQCGEYDSIGVNKYEDGNHYDCEQMIISFKKSDSDEVARFVQYLNNIIVNNATEWDDKYSVDINLKGVSKGVAVQWLYEKLDIKKEDTVGFGDGSNDVSLFGVVGKSVSVENANSNIKAQADDVTLSCEDYGIYKYIEDNILK